MSPGQGRHDGELQDGASRHAGGRGPANHGQQKINALPVINDDNELVGALNMHDLLRAGVV